MQLPQIKFQLLNAPFSPRVLFVSADGCQLVQVQPDRFGHNWRKQLGQETYPRFDPIIAAYRKELGVFLDFLHDEQLGPWAPDLVELIYVNEFLAGEAPALRDSPTHLFSHYSSNYSDDFLTCPEDVRLMERHLIRSGGRSLGRLTVSLEPATRTEDRQVVYILTLAARGAPFSPDVDGAFAFFDVAHEWIVRSFTSLTTPEMHERWGRTR